MDRIVSDIARSRFDQEMRALQDAVGATAARRAYYVFASVVRWLRCYGHGDVRLSAIDHLFALKIRCDTVHDVEANVSDT